MVLDGDMPLDWLVAAAHAADASVYGVLQPYIRDEMTGAEQRIWASPAQMRAAASSLLHQGADGLYTWFMRWPLGDAERASLSELGDAELMQHKDKHYALARRPQDGSENHYPFALPVEIAADDRQKHAVDFNVADDCADDRVSQVLLRLKINDLVSADALDINLNGASLADETCRRDYGWIVAPYQDMWLEFDLQAVRPQQGKNRLELMLVERPADLVSPLRLEEVEVEVKYHPLPARGL